jgi:hypothetical protein
MTMFQWVGVVFFAVCFLLELHNFLVVRRLVRRSKAQIKTSGKVAAKVVATEQRVRQDLQRRSRLAVVIPDCEEPPTLRWTGLKDPPSLR